jgi:hypothetical protein
MQAWHGCKREAGNGRQRRGEQAGEGLERTAGSPSQTGRPPMTVASKRPCKRVLEELQLHALTSEAQPSSSSCVQVGSGTCKCGMQGLSEGPAGEGSSCIRMKRQPAMKNASGRGLHEISVAPNTTIAVNSAFDATGFAFQGSKPTQAIGCHMADDPTK